MQLSVLRLLLLRSKRDVSLVNSSTMNTGVGGVVMAGDAVVVLVGFVLSSVWFVVAVRLAFGRGQEIGISKTSKTTNGTGSLVVLSRNNTCAPTFGQRV